MEIKKLDWSEPSPPDKEYYYDHVVAKTVFGKVVITWKSWKEQADYYVEFPFEWESFGKLQQYNKTLTDAKQFAQDAWTKAIRSCITMNHSITSN